MPELPIPDESIFAAAAALPAEQRAAHLNASCTDAAQRERVEQLLRSHQEAGSFLEGPAIAARTADFVPPAEAVGGVIGRYKLLQVIGEGGFGVVYMAEQKEPIRRKVALKVIKLGMDSREVVARFEAERQALALMDHPNIARVLDAGATETGRPYFVMELVRGVPIVEFCDKNQLSTRQRLAIFAAICQAVQHAHQKGIIHRDLKPSNVLVTLHDGKPVPKVIDFGVAKALNQELTEKTLFTAYGHMVGTPQYMSPEQAEMSGLDIDTRSDIYSLGVLLYELLTGTTPLEGRRLRNAGFAEMQRMIREEEPQRPSMRLSSLGERLSVVAKDRQCNPLDLQKLLHGEVDWIVMKALEKERSRRYDTAAGMAQDVERYLAGDTVEACPPSASYRMRKFVRKHRKGLTLAAAFALLMVAALVATSWQAVRATLAEGDARDKSESLAAAETEVRAERDDARNARDELRSSLYAARANLIQTAYRSDNMARVQQLLDQQRPKPGEPDLRGFEWHYFRRLAHADLRTFDLGADTAPGGSPVMSTDGSRLAAATSVDNSTLLLRVWDLGSGKMILSTRVNGNSYSLALSGDGKRVAMAPFQLKFGFGGKRGYPVFLDGEMDAKSPPKGRLIVWDCDTGEERLSMDGMANGVALSRDGRRVAADFQGKEFQEKRSGSPLELQVWDVDAHKQLTVVHELKKASGDTTFSPDGERLATLTRSGPGFRPELGLWDVTGKKHWTIQADHSDAHVEFTPDGTRLICSTAGNYFLTNGEIYQLRFRDAVDGKEASSISSTVALRNIVCSPNGKLVAGGAGPNVQITNISPQETVTLKGHTKTVSAVAFSADGSQVVSIDLGGTVKVWATPQFGSPWEADEISPDSRISPYSIGLSPKGTYRLKYVPRHPGMMKLLAEAKDHSITVFDRTGKRLYAFEGHAAPISTLEFTQDDRYVISRDHNQKCLVWEAATGKIRLILDGGKATKLNANGSRIAGWTPEGELKVWDTNNLEVRFNVPEPTENAFLVFSPDGSRLLVFPMRSDEKVGFAVGPFAKLWDIENVREICVIPCGKNYPACSFDPTSRRFALAEGTEVAIWDAVSGTRVTTLRLPEMTTGLSLNAGGSLLATFKGRFLVPGAGMLTYPALAAANDGIAVWDVADGKVRYRLRGHTAKVVDVTFSPDGKRIASLAPGFGIEGRGEVKLWDAATGTELLELRSDSPLPGFNLVFNADGTRLSCSAPFAALSARHMSSGTWDATPPSEK
jgi:serine/threonine protein kinase/WD40 repeat protein